jgi:aminoglycoside/choline kinase family phosphotransferase
MGGIDEFFLPFLNKFFSDSSFRVYSLAGDASNRRYYRVVKEQSSWVLMQWEPFDPSKYPFLSVLNHFKNNGVHVPNVVAMSPQEGLLLLEDLGDLTLERKFWENQNQDTSLDFYKMALDELIKIQFTSTINKAPCTAFDIQFDTDKFMWEMNYAYEHLLKGICKVNLESEVEQSLKALFLDICQTLDREPKYIAHRDYHSRNLMIKFNEIRVIDFQDARLGPIQYDLASLIRDSYVQLSDQSAQSLINYYLEQTTPYLNKSSFSVDHFNHIYELQTIQRSFKACGSFASFYMMRQDTRYLKYLPKTLKRVLKSIGEFPKYKLLSDIIIDSGALERKFEVI